MREKGKMKKSTKAKLLSVLAILLSLFISATTFMVSSANERLNDAMVNQRLLIVHADDFGDASSYLTSEVRSYAATGNKEHYDNYWYEVNTAKNREINVEAMKAIGLTENEVDMIDTIATISNNLVPLEEQAMALVEQGNLDEANAILYGQEYSTGLAKIKSVINEFDESISTRSQASVDSMHTWVNAFNILAYVAGVVVLLMLALIIKFVLGELINPIVKIEKKMMEFSEGHLDGEFDLPVDNTEIGRTSKAIHDLQDFQKAIINDIDYLLTEMSNGNFNIKSRATDKYIGDYHHILESIRTINKRLSATLSEIREAVRQVDVGGDQVSSAAQALSQGATEQAASVQELSATIEDVSVHIAENAKNTKEAERLSNIAGDGVMNSNAQMQELIAAMTEINDSSSEIGKIIKTIEDIAFQTNILALNAAVEAARAGAAGKGFAVVADEVRNLASKSAEAAKNTTALIEGSLKAIENGTQIADNTAKSLEEVVTSAKAVLVTINEISEASEKQALAAKQITVGIEQISSVVQTNSATAEESAAASEELSGQANMLEELINQFQLRDENGVGAPAPKVTSSAPSAPSTPKASAPSSSHVSTPSYSPSYTSGNDKYSF